MSKGLDEPWVLDLADALAHVRDPIESFSAPDCQDHETLSSAQPLFRATATSCAERAYATLAPYYDAFTRHHQHDVRLERREGLALEHGLAGRRVLDVACGTGKSLLPLVRRGYDGAGCDLSAGMLERARTALPDAPLHRPDMRALPSRSGRSTGSRASTTR